MQSELRRDHATEIQITLKNLDMWGTGPVLAVNPSSTAVVFTL
jgi:hypothetical protein